MYVCVCIIIYMYCEGSQKKPKPDEEEVYYIIFIYFMKDLRIERDRETDRTDEGDVYTLRFRIIGTPGVCGDAVTTGTVARRNRERSKNIKK